MSLFGDLNIVLDTGSRYTKAGFAGEHFPRAFFPTVVGRFRHRGVIEGHPHIYVGKEAIQKRGVSNLIWPVQEGLIKDWDEIEKLWFHVFYKELLVPPEECRILHSVHPLVPKGDREKMAEILFETFAVEALNLVKSPVLTLYASGRSTGLVYENGACSSFVTPVYEGFPLLHTAAHCDLTGAAISRRLTEMLADRGYTFYTSFEEEVVDDIMAKKCYLATNYKEECKKFGATGESSVTYELPGGDHVLLGDERFKCCEILFQPSLGGLTCPSIVEYMYQSVLKCDMDIRHKMFENIVMSGGATQFPGLRSRLFIELVSRMKMDGVADKVVIDELPTRQTVPWVGGSILASMKNLKGFWMTKQEYADVGADRVNYKFF